MGYTTTFKGRFQLDKPLRPEHAAYINALAETRRMMRNGSVAANLPDPVRLAADLPIGTQGESFVGGSGFAGQDSDASVVNSNQPPSTQPGLWCQWVVTEDGAHIEWDGNEKFYDYTEWLQYICDNFLKRWGYALNGQVTWQGESHGDIGTIVVANNEVSALDGVMRAAQ
jgi:hypothetical protein